LSNLRISWVKVRWKADVEAFNYEDRALAIAASTGESSQPRIEVWRVKGVLHLESP